MRIGLLFGGIALATALLGSGCSSHSIREGIWRHSVDAEDVATKEKYATEDMKVELRLGWSEDGGEVVEIIPLAFFRDGGWAKPKKELKPIWGIIPAETAVKVLHIRTQIDPYYVFNMYGTIVSPEAIDGRRFEARHRENSNLALSGRWRMVWMGPVE